MATPARAEAAASLPVFLIKSRREVRLFGVSFMADIFWTLNNRCQFKKDAAARVSVHPHVVCGPDKPPCSGMVRVCRPAAPHKAAVHWTGSLGLKWNALSALWPRPSDYPARWAGLV